MTSSSVDRFVEHHGWTGSPEDLMVHLCTTLLAETGCGVPVDVRRLASWQGAVVEEADQPLAGWLGPVGDKLVIRVRASDVEGRRRFTVCHEVCHTFFPDFRSSPKARAEPDVERYDERDPEEYLCDLGASELLLPRETFGWLLRDDFGIEDVLEIAEHFRASIEATARRCVLLSRGPAAVAVLEPDETRSDALRVRWAVSTGLPPIARGEVVGMDTRLGATDDHTAYRGEVELLPGTFQVSARSLPYVRDGMRVERTLVLLRPSG